MNRLPLLPTLVVCCLPVISQAAQAWAPGVSSSGGWVDYNKTCTNPNNYMADMGMCWAASASNVITWWQTHNADKLSVANKPENAFNEYETETYKMNSTWDVFRTVYKDDGGVPSTAYGWYIDGLGDGSIPESMDLSLELDKEAGTGVYPFSLWEGGFLKNVYDTSDVTLSTYVATFNGNSYDFAREIVNALNGGYALSISTYDGPRAHAYTLWGVEYTESDGNVKLSKAWITNSDDGKEALVEREVIFKDAPGGHSISFTDDTVPGVALAWQRVDGMRIAIPEPSAFGLLAGMLALAFVGTSRRNRRS